MKITYVNGRYQRHDLAQVSVEDRGYQFADGVYEVIAMVNGELLDGDKHFSRLERSLTTLAIPLPMSLPALVVIINELKRRNRREDGFLYIQITRGVAPRNHALTQLIYPSLVITFLELSSPSIEEYRQGISVVTIPDNRWGRCDVKSISLLPNILAKRQAVSANAKEAWLVNEHKVVTEGSASNAFIVDKNDRIHTQPESQTILGGVTRSVVLDLARQNNIEVIEKPFTVDDAFSAKEAFQTSTTAGVLPVTRIDNKKIGEGMPGAVSRKLMTLYSEHYEPR